MNYPLLFHAVYCEPVQITAAHYGAIHSVLWPRITGQSAAPLEIRQATPRPNTRGHSRAQFAGPSRDAAGNTDWQYFYTLDGRQDVAVIPISGIMAKNAGFFEEVCQGMVNPDRVSNALAQAVADKSIHTIVLDVTSPGGTSVGTPELAAQVRAAAKQKTIYAFTDYLMASAAYFVASQATEILTTPSAQIGSIGTILGILDETVRMQMEGVKLELFSAGTHKGIGMPGRPLTQEDRAYLTQRLQATNEGFVNAVKAGRPKVSQEALTAAKMYPGASAHKGQSSVDHGLADYVVADWSEFVSLL